MRRKNRLRVLLVILVSIFNMFSAAALLLAGFQKSEREAQKKKEAMAALESLPTAAPTEVPVTPSPVRHRGQQRHQRRYQKKK